MQIQWLAIVAVVAAVLLGGVTAVLGVMLSVTKKRLETEADRNREKSHEVSLALESQAAAHSQEIENFRQKLAEPVRAGEVVLFRIKLENDRLSKLHLSGFIGPGMQEEEPFEQSLERVHESDRAMVRAAVIDSITRQRPLELVYRAATPERVRFFHLRGKTRQTGRDGSVELSGTITEITSLMLAQQEQAEWIETLEELNDVLPYGLWAFGADEVMTVWNRTLETITGIPAEEVVGINRNSITAPGFAAIVREPDDDSLDQGFFKADIATEEEAVHCRVCPVSLSHGDGIAQTFGIVERMNPAGGTRGKAAEMEALGRLTAEVAHDFANLVHIIMGYADILNQDLRDNARLLPPFLMDDLGQIQNAAVRAEELVRQIVTFCSRDSQNATRCDINEVVKGFMGLIRRIVGDAINVRFHPRQDLGIAFADEGMIERLILRLMLRLKETLPGGGVVVISTMNVSVDPEWPLGDMAPGDYVKLSVSTDTVGWGRDPDADSGNPDSRPMSELMSLNGGCVNLHESPELGTTVSLYFRMAVPDVRQGVQPEAVAGPGSDEAERTGSGDFSGVPDTKGTILVVEDDTPVRRLTAKALTMAGHIVLEAADGAEAISLFNKDPNRIDLLITDVIMPGMNGRQVCDEIKRVRPELPVLFCSGYSSDLLRNEYMLNIQGLVIQKPYRSADLVAAAAKLLASSQAPTHEAPGPAGNQSPQ